MATNDAGLSDEVQAEVNGDGQSPAVIPDRPSSSAKKTIWVDYVVALGMHPDLADDLTTDQLIDMADRLRA